MSDLLLQDGASLLHEDGGHLLLEEQIVPVGITIEPSKPVVIVSRFSEGVISRSDQRLATLVEVLIDGRVEAVIEDVLDGSVTLDGNASVRGRMSLSVAATPDTIVTGPDSLLAPYGNELRIYRGLEFSDRIELIPLGVFRIDQTTCGDTVEISGQDRAAKFAGSDGAFETSGQILSGADPMDTVHFLLAQVWPGIRVNLPSVAVALPALFFEEADDRWEFCRGIVESLGGALYFDRIGELAVQPIPVNIPGDPIAEIAEDQDGVLLGIERNWDRANVYNRVIVTGENPDSSDDVPRGEAVDTNPFSPTNYHGPFGQKTDRWPNTFITTNAQAEAAAKGRLARFLGAPDTVSFTSIVDPGLSPGDVVRVRREVLELNEDHILDSVTIPLAHTGTLSATTRVAQVLL